MNVLAAVEDDLMLRPVLYTARRLARLFERRLEGGGATGGRLAAKATARTVKVPVRMLFGGPTELVKAAMRADAVLLGVLSSAGIQRDRRPVGATALEIVQEARKPVAVVTPKVLSGQTTGLKRVLVPLDASAASTSAVASMVERLRAADVQIVALHVFDQEHFPRFMDHMPCAYDAWKAEFLARYCSCSDARLVTRLGDAPAAVIDTAVEEGADMILLSCGGGTSGERRTLTRQVLRHSHIPVVLMPVAAGVSRQVLEPSG